jgi:hypothetical protein
MSIFDSDSSRSNVSAGELILIARSERPTHALSKGRKNSLVKRGEELHALLMSTVRVLKQNYSHSTLTELKNSQLKNCVPIILSRVIKSTT